MTRRVPCPPAPGPLEGYAARFDDLFGSLAQRRGFRGYLAGLLEPRDRNKTLTALAGTESAAGTQHPAVQRLQFFLPESRWDPERVGERLYYPVRAVPYTPARHFAKGRTTRRSAPGWPFVTALKPHRGPGPAARTRTPKIRRGVSSPSRLSFRWAHEARD